MKIKVAVLAAVCFLFPVIASAQTTHEAWVKNSAGIYRTLRATDVADDYMPLLNLRAGLDTTYTVDFPGLVSGESFRLLLHSGSAGTLDSLWLYYADGDSVPLVNAPGEVQSFPVSLKEGETFRLDINSTGGFIYGRLEANDNR